MDLIIIHFAMNFLSLFLTYQLMFYTNVFLVLLFFSFNSRALYYYQLPLVTSNSPGNCGVTNIVKVYTKYIKKLLLLLLLLLLIILRYRQLPLVSPGLIQLRKGFRWAYKRRGLYPRGLITGIKTPFRNELEQS